MTPTDELLAKASSGDAQAQLDVANAYQNPVGWEQDNVRAVEWLRKAAAQGLSEAQHRLGVSLQLGLGTEKNIAGAIHWLSQAAHAGHTSARIQLGFMYLQGNGVEKNVDEAARWFRRAAESGNSPAQYNLATVYAGIQCPDHRDDAEALKWFQKAAEQGHPAAQYELGGIYSEGRGVSKDHSLAMKWFEKAANQGYAGAHTNLHRLTLPHEPFRDKAGSGHDAEDLGAAIKARPFWLRILRILRVDNPISGLRLTVALAPLREFRGPCEIVCFNVADYCIRPTNPATMEGGPEIKLHESHPLLGNPHLQMIPGGDGEVFRPPLQLKLLVLDQSHVIAERFELHKGQNHRSNMPE